MSEQATIPEKPLIVFVDSQCVVCNGLVEWMLKKDKEKLFKFAGLNSDYFQKLKTEHALTDVPDSVVLYDKGELFYKSDAVLRMFRKLGFPWSWIHSAGRWLPKKWSDAIYDWVARHRYAWFGQTEEDFCKMPDPKHRGRFLN